METRANYVVVGLFTLAVIAAAFGFVYWFHHVGGTAERVQYRVAFQGPIGGLRNGAAVTFNGIRVGEVVALSLDPDNPRQALATVAVERNTPVRADTEVTLDYQGLTGIAALSLRGGAPGAAPLAAKDGAPPLLAASPAASQDLMQAARDAIRRIDGFIADNEKTFRNSMRNIESFTEVLSRNSDKIDSAIRNLDTFVGMLSRNSERIDVSIRNVENFTGTLTRNSERIEAAIRNVDTFTQVLAKNSERVDRILAGVDAMIGGADGKGEIAQAARAIRNTAENLDRKIDGLVADGRRTFGVIERTVKNFDENPTRLLFGTRRPAAEAQSGSGSRRSR